MCYKTRLGEAEDRTCGEFSFALSGMGKQRGESWTHTCTSESTRLRGEYVAQSKTEVQVDYLGGCAMVQAREDSVLHKSCSCANGEI